MNKAKKAKWNTITSLIYQVCAMIFSFITPRLIIQYYGSEYNGLISSYTKFFSFISILRIGVVSSVRFTLYKPLAENDINRVSGILVSTEKYMRKIAYIFIGYTFFVVGLFPFISNSNIPTLDIILLGGIVSVGIFSEYYFGITYNTLLSADQTLYKYTLMQIITTIGYNVIAICLMYWGTSIYYVRIIYAVLFTIGPCILAYQVTKEYKIDKKVPPIDDALELRKDAMMQSIANIVHDTVDIAVITFFMNISMVSVYYVYSLVVSGINAFFSSLINGLEAAFGNYWASDNKKIFNENLHVLEYICALIIIVIFSSVFILFLPFIKLYTANITDANYVLPLYAFLTTIVALTNAIRQPYIISVQAAGKYKETKYIAMAEAFINLIISVVAVKIWGIFGVAIGTIIADSYRTIRYAMFTYKELLGESIRVFVKVMLWMLFGIVMSVICINVIISFICIDSWKGWVLSGVICIGVSLVIAILLSIVFYKNYLKKLIGLVRKSI